MARLAATLIALAAVFGPSASFDDTFSLVTVRQNDPRPLQAGVTAPSVSGDGRYVAFVSFARLVEGDTDDRLDVYVLDRVSGRVTLETPSNGPGAAYESDRPRLSADGRLLVFVSRQQGEADDPSARWTIVVRDRETGATRQIGPPGGLSNGSSREPTISGDGRLVVFASSATNLVDAGDANGSAEDVYAFDVNTGRISRVSVAASGRQLAAGSSVFPTVSANGRYVAFTSSSPLDSSDGRASARPTANVYVRDLIRGTTIRVSTGAHGAVPNGPSYDAEISASGRYVAFVSEASNLVPKDRNGYADVFVRDLETETTTLVTRSMNGGSANGPSTQPAISADGEAVVFQSDASDLVCGTKCALDTRDINLVADVFVWRRGPATIECISRDRRLWMEPSVTPATDATGSVVAFSSRHPVDAYDVANDFDLFVWAGVRNAGPRSSAR